MAHPNRAEFIPSLTNELGNVPVIWDEKSCVWDTRRRCLEAHLKVGAEWSLTLQDDSILTEDFVKKALAFIAKHDRRGRRTHSFNFYFWNRGTLAHFSRKRGYYRGRGMKSGVAICLRTNLIPALLKHWEGKRELLRHDDSRIGRFLRSRAMYTIYPCPSLVQHRDSKSLIYTPDEVPFIRKALYFNEK